MRRIVLTVALLLAGAAAPAVALDLGRWVPSVDLPSWPRIEGPDSRLPTTPANPDADAPVQQSVDAPGADRADAVEPPAPQELDPTLSGAAADAREARRTRPRGWRGLLPGSLK